MLTRHACIRSHQRAISRLTVDLLLQFGASEKSHDGSRKLYFDKAARRRLAAYAGPMAGLLQEHLNVYAVIGQDESVVTVGHLTERIKRH